MLSVANSSRAVVDMHTMQQWMGSSRAARKGARAVLVVVGHAML